MSLWPEAMDRLSALESENDLTVDQQLQALQVLALLSISQELSAINPLNTMYRDDEGKARNGWGFLTRRF